MSIIIVSAKLDRTDSQTPWGFRMAGGKDYNSPLIIQKVNPGSLSSKCGIRENDTITHISGCNVANLSHKDAQDLIIGSGNNLELKLERSSGSSHNSGGDGYFQPHQSSLPWQQQPYKPSTGMIGLAPKPFQKPGAITTITSHMANFSIGGAPGSTTQDTEQPLDVNANNTEKIAPPLDNNLHPTSTGCTIEMEDSNLTNENCSGKESSGVPSVGNAPIPTESVVTKDLIGDGRLDTRSNENSEGMGQNLAAVETDRSDSSNAFMESGRIFEGRTSEGQPQSRSFRRLQGLLQEEDIRDEDKGSETSNRTSQPPTAQQTSINNKPQILAKPKVPPVMPKPFAPTNRLNSLDKEPSRSEAIPLAEDCTSSNPSGSPSPDPNKSRLQPESRAIRVIPPTMPKPKHKQYNTPIGLYSKQTLVETGISAPEQPSYPAPTPPPEVSIKEVPSGGDIIVKVPSQRKSITINKIRVDSPSSSQSDTAAAAVAEVIVQSGERKQIVIKSNSAGRSTPQIAGQSSGAVGNGSKNLLQSSAPIGPGDVIYGSEKPKIVLKKREQTSEKKDSMDFTLEDLGLADAVVVGISLPSCMKECLPADDVDLVESRSQIKVVPKAAHNSHQSFGAPNQHPSSGTVVWRPQVPVGERKMKIGRPGQAQRRPPMAGSARIPICTSCHSSIRGPFVTALDKTWCPEHFVCANPNCAHPLFDCGFVEEADQLYCEKDYEKYLAPRCARCSGAIVGEVVNAMKNAYHLQCFVCTACHQPIGNGSFHNEDGKIYCAKDWGALFQTKCYGCQFPVEPGDRWVEALSQNWHSECFNCSTCQINLEGQSFCAKNGKPYCKKHGAAQRF